jgi:lysophospholipase L1-like esterase
MDDSVNLVVQGAPGPSAYELWLLSGNTGSLEDFFAAVAADQRGRYVLPSRFLTRRVMASPPTVTYSSSGTHTLGSNRVFMPSADGSAISSTFNYRKMSKPVAVNAEVSDRGCSYGLVPGASTASHMSSVACTYDGLAIEFTFANNGQKLWIKVDGEYVSFTPTTLATGSAPSILYINFGSAKMREIEVILCGVGQTLRFGGAYIEPTASIAPVAPRGPRTFILGDSFGEGTGVTTSEFNVYGAVLGDLLGWDDIIISAVGQTGLLATGGGTKLNYRQRVAADVLAFQPELVIIQGSINDTGETTTAVSTELQLLIATINAAAPHCRVIVTSMLAADGGGFAPPAFYLASEGFKQGAEAAGVGFINLIEQPLPPQAAIGGTITRVAASNATRLYTSIKVPRNTTLKFPNGTHFRTVLGTESGSGDFICDGDQCTLGAAIGDTFTVVGNSAWSGNGNTASHADNGNCDLVVCNDNVHPSDAGHIMIGTGIAYGLAKALNQ